MEDSNLTIKPLDESLHVTLRYDKFKLGFMFIFDGQKAIPELKTNEFIVSYRA